MSDATIQGDGFAVLDQMVLDRMYGSVKFVPIAANAPFPVPLLGVVGSRRPQVHEGDGNTTLLSCGGHSGMPTGAARCKISRGRHTAQQPRPAQRVQNFVLPRGRGAPPWGKNRAWGQDRGASAVGAPVRCVSRCSAQAKRTAKTAAATKDKAWTSARARALGGLCKTLGADYSRAWAMGVPEEVRWCGDAAL